MHPNFAAISATAQHPRIAGLDGVRGVAVALVLGFHLYPRLVPGGWLGVSLFFTLSGFLITTVILRDLDNNTFTFRSFYARRARRLLPAALLVLALFTLSWTLLGWFDTNHRTDVFFSFLQIANWQQIWEGIPYGTALASPVVHYWSLAIEEQAYLVLPLLIVVFGAKRLRLVAPLLFLCSVAATFLANQNQSLIYFGTHTRAAEILAGVIVAVVMHNTSRTPKAHIATTISAAGLLYLITASVFIHLNDDIVYQGGLVITGVISAAVIATVPYSPIAKILNLTPLVWLGTVSYGIYLIHWPVLLTLKRADLPQWAISPITLVTTLILATLMHRYYETPLKRTPHVKKALMSLPIFFGLFFASAVFARSPLMTFEEIPQEDTDMSGEISNHEISLFVVGDSRALAFSQGVNLFFKNNEDQRKIFTINQTFAELGCPIGRGGRKDTTLGKFEIPEKCDWGTIESIRSQIGVVWAGQWDSVPRDPLALVGDKFFTLSDNEYRTWLKGEYAELFRKLRSSGTIKAIAVVNHNQITDDDFPLYYNEFLTELAQEEEIILLDLEKFTSTTDLRSYLPDERHVSFGIATEYSPNNDNSAGDLYKKWFEPALCAAIQQKIPSLLQGRECPPIDNTPRLKN